jgi:hypothetical protein
LTQAPPAEAMPHSDAEAAIRGSDWRFLLPEDDAATAGRVCGPVLPVREANDVRRLVAAAAPGTWLCLEFPSGGARGIHRTIASAGAEDIALYVPWPTASRPRAWIPSGDAATAAHVIASLRGRGLARRARRGAERAAWRLRFRLGLGLVTRAICRAPGAPQASGGHPLRRVGLRLPETLARAIEARWEEWDLGARPAAYRTTLITGGSRDVNKVVALVFAGAGRRPSLAVKFARVSDAVPGMKREAQALARLGRRPGGPVDGAPRLLLEVPTVANALVETYVAGAPMTTQLTSRTFGELAMTATEWLCRLDDGTTRSGPDDWWPRIVEPTLERFDREFARIADPALVRESIDRLRALGRLPVVPEQRDFAPWNLRLDARGRLGVLDWESAEPNGLPALDLVYFLAYLAFDLENAITSGEPLETYRSLFDERTTVGAVATTCTARYADELALREPDLTALRLLTWLVHTPSDYRRLQAAADGGLPRPDALRSSLFFALWEEEARREA